MTLYLPGRRSPKFTAEFKLDHISSNDPLRSNVPPEILDRDQIARIAPDPCESVVVIRRQFVTVPDCDAYECSVGEWIDIVGAGRVGIDVWVQTLSYVDRPTLIPFSPLMILPTENRDDPIARARWGDPRGISEAFAVAGQPPIPFHGSRHWGCPNTATFSVCIPSTMV